MASVESTSALFEGVLKGNLRRVKAALAAGANVNGSPERPFTPIMAAIAVDDVSMVRFFIKQGADLDRSADHDLPCPSTDIGFMPGDRALHVAAKQGNVEIVRLLERGHADLNAADTRGRTPLMAACACLKDCVPVVRVLLELGANPALADKNGYTPLYAIAQYGVTDLVDVLYTGAPGSLTRYSNDGRTPLLGACLEGHESMVSRLLSLGAMQWMRPHDPVTCPLAVATAKGFEAVVRVLIKEGMPAVGYMMSMPYAIFGAIQGRHAKILQLLLMADGEGNMPYWANITMRGNRPLHGSVALCLPAAVNVLLAAGANETACDSEGRIPRDLVGVDLEIDGLQMNRDKEVAVRRMLEQGPAYRARPWAWPAAEVHGSGCRDCGDSGVVLPSPPAAPTALLSARIFRPKDEGKFFVNVVDRYCRKG